MRASIQRKVFISVSRHNFARTAASDASLGPQHPIFECYSGKRQKKKNSQYWHLIVWTKLLAERIFHRRRARNVCHWIIFFPLSLTYLPNKRREYCLLNLLKLSSFQIALFLCSTSELLNRKQKYGFPLKVSAWKLKFIEVCFESAKSVLQS